MSYLNDSFSIAADNPEAVAKEMLAERLHDLERRLDPESVLHAGPEKSQSSIMAVFAGR